MQVLKYPLLILLCITLYSCAATQPSAIYHYASLSKHSAENLYQSIYAASKQGNVPPDDLVSARAAYTQWSLSQQAYLAAAEAGQYDAVSANAMQAQIHALIAISVRNRVDPWQPNKEYLHGR
jgi:hypothetical protein